MARTKRPPVQREPSSEYTSKLDRTPSRQVAPNDNGDVSNGKVNGHTVAPQTSVASTGKKDGSIVTLVIDVAGIYASLYVTSEG